jgi:hypothetical protein
MPTNFRDVGLSGYKVMSKMARNVNIALYGAFFFGFLYFFLLTVIYLGYETCLRGFATQRPVDIKLCQNWLEMSVMDYMVSFLSDFLIFFLLTVIYLGYEICLRSFATQRPVDIKLCQKWLEMSVLDYMVRFLSDIFIFFANCDLFRQRNMPTRFRDAAPV